ncbi:MAG: hypothetical protein V2A58_01315 [Planctomycetota bacterium]
MNVRMKIWALLIAVAAVLIGLGLIVVRNFGMVEADLGELEVREIPLSFQV